ncbi:ciliary microtubule inner protein 1 [Amia ocellicauda]|uniref:ciliary microtubule inner protein 1 n=1 Tax=Amia ocellicauda TaxID=2972642 RepID=UPI003463A6C4
MAATKTPANPAKTCNYVAQDQIWKCHVSSELESAKAWPSKWGFLTTSYTELLQEMKKEDGKLELPAYLQTRPATPPGTYTQVAPSPAVPQTTQGLIGWRSTVPGLELERFGRVHRGKGSFLKKMGWPHDACD